MLLTSTTGLNSREYEYIVIGAGSAGSIVAAELAKSGSNVLIIEAGGDTIDPYVEDLKQYFNIAFNRRSFGFMHWGYSSTEQLMTGAAASSDEEIKSKVMDLPRGKALGGTHSVNAAAYVQANAEDFDNIARELRDSSWTWKRTEELRLKLETEIGLVELGTEQVGAKEFISTAQRVLGLPLNPDPKNGNQYGISPSFWTARQTPQGGQRRSSFDSFVTPLMAESSKFARRYGLVDVVAFQHVEHLIFDPYDATRVIGVSCINTRAQDLQTKFFASREVIVSAGTYNSPQILLHSGIGPTEHLEAVGIKPQVDLPGVGENLRDHYGVSTFWNLVGLAEDTPFHFQSPVLNMFGPETSGQTSYQMEISGNFGSCVPLRQKSVGTVRLQSPSALDSPLIDPNILSTEDDVNGLVECVKEFLLPFFGGLVQQGLLAPGNLNPNASDEEIRKFVIENVQSKHHPVGTCKVGRDGDRMAVVDKDFKVRGVSNLRVIDASVFPKVPSGNINAPTMTAALIGANKIIKAKTTESRQLRSR